MFERSDLLASHVSRRRFQTKKKETPPSVSSQAMSSIKNATVRFPFFFCRPKL